MGDGEEGLKPPNNPYEHLDLPRRNELSISELLTRREQRIKRYIQYRIPWDHDKIREELSAEANFEQLSLRGPIQIAKGQEPVLAVNSQQAEAIGVLFGARAVDMIERPFYAAIQATGMENPETVEASVKYVSFRPTTLNHLVISEGLASKLGVTDQDDIKITDIYQKIEDIDLDKIQ